MITSNIPQPEDVRDHVRCSFDPNASIGASSAVVREAGAGDVAALRQLLDLSIANLWRCPANAPRALIMAAEAVAFGRLCASHRERRDIRKLAGALCMASDQARQIGYARSLAGEHRAAKLRQQRAIEAVIAADGREQLFKRHPINGCLLAREG